MSVSLTVGKCVFDTHTVTITSPVEADGGDHYLTISFGDPAQWGLVSVKLDGTPVWGSCGMYFTSAGESYTLELKSNVQNEASSPTMPLKWPYVIHALYAPTWADKKSIMYIDLNFDSCCIAGASNYFIYPSGNDPTYPPYSWPYSRASLGGASYPCSTLDCCDFSGSGRSAIDSSFDADMYACFGNPTNRAAFGALVIPSTAFSVAASKSALGVSYGPYTVTGTFSKPASSYTLHIELHEDFGSFSAHICHGVTGTDGPTAGVHSQYPIVGGCCAITFVADNAISVSEGGYYIDFSITSLFGLGIRE